MLARVARKLLRTPVARNMADVQAVLEERIRKLEFVLGDIYAGEGKVDAVRDVQKEFLQDLYALRDALAADLADGGATIGAAGDDTSKELAELREENKKLKYRISHMKRYL